jgi:hypothetical protein
MRKWHLLKVLKMRKWHLDEYLFRVHFLEFQNSRIITIAHKCNKKKTLLYEQILHLSHCIFFKPSRPMVINVSFCHFRSRNCGFVFGHDFLKNLVEVRKWIKYMGKLFFTQNDFPFKSYDKKRVFCKEWAASFPAKHKGKKKFFSNLCGQLLRNFLHMFS